VRGPNEKKKAQMRLACTVIRLTVCTKTGLTSADTDDTSNLVRIPQWRLDGLEQTPLSSDNHI